MSLTMYRALVFLVIVGSVFCDEKNVAEKKPPIPDAAPPDGNSTSSVVIKNKVQNLTVEYKNDHSPKKNTSYVIKPTNKSRNGTNGRPLIISTSKEVRLIQSSPKWNDSLATASIKSNSTQRHPNSIPHKHNNHNHHKKGLHVLPTLKPTEFSSTENPKVPVTQKNYNSTNLDHTRPTTQNYAYLKMSKPKNSSSNIDVERMEVKEMRYFEDMKENKKFQFFIVSDGDITDIDIDPPKKYTSTENYQSQGNFGNERKSMPHKEKTVQTAQSTPYQEDWVPKNYSGNGHSQFILKSTTPMAAYTVRPSRHSWNITTTSAPTVSYKKLNASSVNLVSTEKAVTVTRNFSSFRNNKAKQQKYPTYPLKKDLVDNGRAVKLQGPDGDSILGDSKQHYAVSKPGVPHKYSNSSRFRVPKSGMNTQKDHRGHFNHKERKKPFMGLDSAGTYSAHVGGSVEYSMPKPDSDFHNFRGQGTKKPDMSDLYNLDELESRGSTISSGNVKYDHREIHIPYPVTVEKRVSYPIHIKVDRPVPVRIDKPYPVHIEKRVPVPVKIHVPQPYPIEKEVPYPVKIPIEVPRPVEVPKPVPYIVDKPVPIQVIKEVKFPVKVPVDVPVPYNVPVHVEKRVPFFVEKKVPFEVPIPVEKPYFVEIKKPFEVPVEKPYPVTVEKKIPVPMQMIEFVKVPIPVKVPIEGYKDRSSDSHDGKDGNIGVVPPPKANTTSDEGQIESKFQHRMGTDGNGSNEQQSYPHHLPSMISIEFPHPDLKQDPIVTSYSLNPITPDSETSTT